MSLVWWLSGIIVRALTSESPGTIPEDIQTSEKELGFSFPPELVEYLLTSPHDTSNMGFLSLKNIVKTTKKYWEKVSQTFGSGDDNLEISWFMTNCWIVIAVDCHAEPIEFIMKKDGNQIFWTCFYNATPPQFYAEDLLVFVESSLIM